jgi:hypothetical protein
VDGLVLVVVEGPFIDAMLRIPIDSDTFARVINVVPCHVEEQGLDRDGLHLRWVRHQIIEGGQRQEVPAQTPAQAQGPVEEETKGRRGWFGFGGRHVLVLVTTTYTSY